MKSGLLADDKNHAGRNLPGQDHGPQAILKHFFSFFSVKHFKPAKLGFPVFIAHFLWLSQQQASPPLPLPVFRKSLTYSPEKQDTPSRGMCLNNLHYVNQDDFEYTPLCHANGY